MAQLKQVLKLVKDNESSVSTILGALVVLVLAVLLFTSARNNPSDQSLVALSENQATASPVLVAENEAPTPAPTSEGVVSRVGNFIKSILSPTNKPEELTSEVDEAEPGLVVLERKESGVLVPKSLPDEYRVKSGDTLWAIAKKFYGSGYNYIDIVSANRLKDADSLAEGQVIRLPEVVVRVPVYEDLQAKIEGEIAESSRVYVVAPGDTLWQIAVSKLNNGFRWNEIYQANTDLIKTPGIIEPGWELQIPNR